MKLLFEERLARYTGFWVDCLVTQNRTTMLHLLGKARLSVHEMFLEAPEEVMIAIAAYVTQQRKGRKKHNQCIKEYIHLHYGNYQHRAPKVIALGRHYDLESLMKGIHHHYFPHILELTIGWFRGGQPRRRILFGKYEQAYRLVRINDRLDSPTIPEFFLRYIIYHEMLHAVVPAYLDEKGRCLAHGPEFKRREKLFLDYDRARQWEKENKERFFGRA